MDLLTVILYLIALYIPFGIGLSRLRMQARAGSHSGCLPWATLVLTIVVAVPTILQFFHPSLLLLLRRDASEFFAGQYWRIVTALFVQDGGASGSFYNLGSLALVGGVAERLWGSHRWLIIFFLGGILGELVGLAWQPVGAGNSVANFALAASITVYCLSHNPRPVERIAAYIVFTAGLALLALRDIHGAAVLIGSLLAFGLARLDHRRDPDLDSAL